MSRLTVGDRRHRKMQRREYDIICAEAELERRKLAKAALECIGGTHPSLLRGQLARSIAPGAIREDKPDA